MTKMTTFKSRLFLAALFLSCSLFLILLITSSFHYMWDFKLYYWGTVAYREGLNPLDIESLKQVIREFYERPIFSVAVLEVGREFALLPLMFKLYSPFMYLDIETLYNLFLALKLTALNLLLFVWFRHILPLRDFNISENPVISSLGLAAITLLAWNRTLYLDIEAGNVSMFEQLFIWTGVLFYLKRRFKTFAIFITLASLWKLVPLLFLFLLFPLFLEKMRKREAVYALAAGMGLFIGIHLLSFFTDPEIYRYFFKALARFSDEERGFVNPCIIAMIGDTVDILISKGVLAEGGTTLKIYGVYSVIVCIVAIFYFRALKFTCIRKDPVKFVMFTFLAFALVSPRFKDYSYILLVPPAIYLLSLKNQVERRIMLFILITCPPVFAYYQYLVAWVCFFYFIQLEKPGRRSGHQFTVASQRQRIEN